MTCEECKANEGNIIITYEGKKIDLCPACTALGENESGVE